jgi:hypothetical protein
MLKINVRRILPGKDQKLREWLRSLGARSNEVRERFRAEKVRAERAFIISSAEGPLCVYAIECEDFDYAKQMFELSKLAIDHEHAAVMGECLGEALAWEQVYEMSVDSSLMVARVNLGTRSA